MLEHSSLMNLCVRFQFLQNRCMSKAVLLDNSSKIIKLIFKCIKIGKRKCKRNDSNEASSNDSPKTCQNNWHKCNLKFWKLNLLDHYRLSNFKVPFMICSVSNHSFDGFGFFWSKVTELDRPQPGGLLKTASSSKVFCWFR